MNISNEKALELLEASLGKYFTCRGERSITFEEVEKLLPQYGGLHSYMRQLGITGYKASVFDGVAPIKWHRITQTPREIENISYGAETLEEIRQEIEPILPLHWQEIALSKDKIKLNIDWSRYENLETIGLLKIFSARDAGRLVGYFIGFLVENPHYKGYLMGQADIYYVLPEYRKTGVGSGLFRFVEKVFRDLGAVKIIAATKLHADASALFEHLGWTKIEAVFTKYIGD